MEHDQETQKKEHIPNTVTYKDLPIETGDLRAKKPKWKISSGAEARGRPKLWNMLNDRHGIEVNNPRTLIAYKSYKGQKKFLLYDPEVKTFAYCVNGPPKCISPFPQCKKKNPKKKFHFPD